MTASRPAPRRTGILTRFARVARLAVHVIYGVAVTTAIFPFSDQRARTMRVRNWSHRLLAILNVKLRVIGELPIDATHPVLILANHVSWLDIFAIDSVCPVRFVAKSEVRAWPLIGVLSTKAGTIYIERARRQDTGRVSRSVTAALKAGEHFAVFPEGTTTDGTELFAFHSSLIAPALAAAAVICPAAVRYTRSDGTLCTEAAYDGAKTLADTMRLILAQRVIHVELIFMQPLSTANKNRRELTLEVEAVIARQLGLPIPRRKSGTASGPPGESPKARAPRHSPSRSPADRDVA